jgi:hypothetical protein
MTLGTPEGGADTVTIPITLKGSGSTVTGHIIQIRKVLSGTTFWFITSFEK